ncbi:hypothetical protein MYU51_007251 [Penicillium brevicompactum]
MQTIVPSALKHLSIPSGQLAALGRASAALTYSGPGEECPLSLRRSFIILPTSFLALHSLNPPVPTVFVWTGGAPP